MPESLVKVVNVNKTYQRGGEKLVVLDDLNLEVPKGDFLALMGPSGSGKSTLLNLIGGLDSPTSGRVEVDGENLDVKNSIDITISPKEIKLPGNGVFEKYFNNLFSCYQDYTTQWPFLTEFAENLQIGEFNLQRYQSGQHFQSTHTERSSLDTLHRIFAWMTYLNDVDIVCMQYFQHLYLDLSKTVFHLYRRYAADDDGYDK